jgi:RimJ/RimL family protein N-acetyltransferase
MSFPTHRTPDDALAFIAASTEQWNEWRTGPFLIRLRSNNLLIGGTGLHLETPFRAMTGYILSRDSWGNGYATEALGGMIDAARLHKVRRLYAICHAAHERSWKVLERGGFEREGILRAHTVFPNIDPHQPLDVFSYSLIL